MNEQINQSTVKDNTKVVGQNPNAPAFTKSESAPKVAPKQTAQVIPKDPVKPNQQQPVPKSPTEPVPATDEINPPLQAAAGSDSAPKGSSPVAEADPVLKTVAKETAQEAIHQVMPKAEAKKIEAEAKQAEQIPAKDPVSKDTAAHGDDDLMSKKAQS